MIVWEGDPVNEPYVLVSYTMAWGQYWCSVRVAKCVGVHS